MLSIAIYWQYMYSWAGLANFIMETATINISMPTSLKEEVDAAIAEEGYGNTSEFFRALVRDHLNEREEKRLERLILEGLNSGPATPLTKEDFDDIRRVITERHVARQKAK